MKKLLIVLCVLTLLCTSIFAAGQRDSGSGQIEVGIVMKSYQSPYFKALSDSVENECKKLGWQVTVLGSDDNVEKEAANIDSLIQKKVHLMFVDCIDPTSTVPAQNRAVAAGIPVINIDSGVGPGCNDVTTVYSNNIENGRAVGKAYVKYAGNDKPLVGILLSGVKGNVAGLERRSGLIAGIIGARLNLSDSQADTAAAEIERQLVSTGRAENAAAKFRIAGQGWGDWSRIGGQAAGEDLITANKATLNLMMAENDEMNLGARVALVNAGLLDVDIIAAADGSKAAYDLIKNGQRPRYIATGENSPVKVGIKAVEVAKQILIDKKPWSSFNKITLTDAFGVTADMVDAHYNYGF